MIWLGVSGPSKYKTSLVDWCLFFYNNSNIRLHTVGQISEDDIVPTMAQRLEDEQNCIGPTIFDDGGLM